MYARIIRDVPQRMRVRPRATLGRFNSNDPSNNAANAQTLLAIGTQDARDAFAVITAGYMILLFSPQGSTGTVDNYAFAMGVLGTGMGPGNQWKVKRGADGNPLIDSNDGTHTLLEWNGTSAQPVAPNTSVTLTERTMDNKPVVVAATPPPPPAPPTPPVSPTPAVSVLVSPAGSGPVAQTGPVETVQMAASSPAPAAAAHASSSSPALWLGAAAIAAYFLFK